MNNRPNITKLSGNKSRSDSVKRSLLTDLVLYEHVKTTKSKANAVLPLFDKVINIAKNEDKRAAQAKLDKIFFSDNATAKVMEVLTKRLAKDNGGYIKVYKLGKRKGDNAEMVKMMVKGYAYKEVGGKVKSSQKAETKKKSDKVEEQETKFGKPTKQEPKDMQSQVDTKAAQGKAKSRSGI